MNTAQLQYHTDKALSDVARLEKQQLLCVVEGHDDEAQLCDVLRAFWADEARVLRNKAMNAEHARQTILSVFG